MFAKLINQNDHKLNLINIWTKFSKKNNYLFFYKQISLYCTTFNIHAPFVLFEKAYCLYRSILCPNHGLIHFSSLLHGLAGRNVGLEAVPVACSLEKLVSIKGHSISMKFYVLSWWRSGVNIFSLPCCAM